MTLPEKNNALKVASLKITGMEISACKIGEKAPKPVKVLWRSLSPDSDGHVYFSVNSGNSDDIIICVKMDVAP